MSRIASSRCCVVQEGSFPARSIRLRKPPSTAANNPSRSVVHHLRTLMLTSPGLTLPWFDAHATARSRLRTSIQRHKKLKDHLRKDLANHGDPAEHKKIGDLLLANVATATRDGNKVVLIDYYANDAPQIEMEVDENTSLQDEAARRFRLYTKAKHAREEIVGRLENADRELAQSKPECRNSNA